MFNSKASTYFSRSPHRSIIQEYRFAGYHSLSHELTESQKRLNTLFLDYLSQDFKNGELDRKKFLDEILRVISKFIEKKIPVQNLALFFFNQVLMKNTIKFSQHSIDVSHESLDLDSKTLFDNLKFFLEKINSKSSKSFSSSHKTIFNDCLKQQLKAPVFDFLDRLKSNPFEELPIYLKEALEDPNDNEIKNTLKSLIKEYLIANLEISKKNFLFSWHVIDKFFNNSQEASTIKFKELISSKYQELLKPELDSTLLIRRFKKSLFIKDEKELNEKISFIFNSQNPNLIDELFESNKSLKLEFFKKNSGLSETYHQDPLYDSSSSNTIYSRENLTKLDSQRDYDKIKGIYEDLTLNHKQDLSIEEYQFMARIIKKYSFEQTHKHHLHTYGIRKNGKFTSVFEVFYHTTNLSQISLTDQSSRSFNLSDQSIDLSRSHNHSKTNRELFSEKKLGHSVRSTSVDYSNHSQRIYNLCFLLAKNLHSKLESPKTIASPMAERLNPAYKYI